MRRPSVPLQEFKIGKCRGAIFRAKRWFYMRFYDKSLPPEVREKNRQTWVDFAAKMVKEANERGISDKTVRLTIEYIEGENKEFKPVAATFEVLELRPVDVVKVFMISPDVSEIREKFAELVEKAKALGLSPEDLKRLLFSGTS